MVGLDRIELSSRDPKSRACPSSYSPNCFGGQPGNRTPNSRLQAERVPISTSRPYIISLRVRLDTHSGLQGPFGESGYRRSVGLQVRSNRSTLHTLPCTVAFHGAANRNFGAGGDSRNPTLPLTGRLLFHLSYTGKTFGRSKAGKQPHRARFQVVLWYSRYDPPNLEESRGIEPLYAGCSDIHWLSGPAPYRSANSPHKN